MALSPTTFMVALTLQQYNRCLTMPNDKSIEGHNLPILMPLCQLNVTPRDLMWILSSDSMSVTKPMSSWECNLSSKDLSRFFKASRTRSIRSNARETKESTNTSSAIYNTVL
jgi:hypothetical protein